MRLKVDAYTKFVLTVIAICLCWISIKDFIKIPNAIALSHENHQKVYIEGIVLGGTDYTFSSVGLPVCTGESIDKTNKVIYCPSLPSSSS